MIPDSFIEELKYASDIERTISSYITLKRKGRNLSGLCPFHSEKTPSFTVYPDNQSYYCFGCGNGGDVITFIRQIESLEYVEALRFLAQKAGLTVPEDAGSNEAARLKARILELNREAARFFHTCLIGATGKTALQYLLDRGLDGKTIKKFGLGYAPDGWDGLRNHLRDKGYSQEEMLAATVVSKGRGDSCYDMFRARVMFPIIDLRGNVIGFGGRIMGDAKGPKYLNSADTAVFKKSRNLFALNFAKSTKADTLVLGEGYMDVIAMHQAGFDNAVATLGTSLTEEQARLISQYTKKVSIAYDSDVAGQAATKRAINLFQQTDVAVNVLEIKDAKDPDEYIKKFGATRFGNLVSSGKGAIHFEIDKLKAQFDLDDSQGKVAFLSSFCKLMASIQDELSRDVYIGEVARELEVGKDRLVAATEGLRKKKAQADRKKDAHNLRAYAQDNAGIRGSARNEANLAVLVAEEKLISMLIKNPDYYDSMRQKVLPEDFVHEDCRQIWTVLADRLHQNQPIEMIYLSAQLSPQLMAKLSKLETAARGIQFYPQQADEYIAVLKTQNTAKSAQEMTQMSPEQLQEYLLHKKGSKK